MSARKSERIMNLAICLLMARRFIEKAQIRELVEGYAGLSDGAFERTFERDKDELRAMGVPVETGSNSAFFPDEVGYRIRRRDFELPPLDVSPAEATALGLASQVWNTASLAERTTSAMAKLRAAGIDPDASPVLGLAPSVAAREPAFEVLWQATLSRTPVAFGYRGQPRQVQPWSLTYRRGAWYLLGHDTGKDAPRMFKLARIDGEARTTGKPGSYRVPEGVDLPALARSLEPAQPDAEAILAIHGDHAPELRRRGTAVDPPVELPPGFAAYRVPYSHRGDFAGDVAGYGADVLVVAPGDLRTAVVAHLGSVVGVRDGLG